MAIIEKTANTLRSFQDNLADMNVRPYDPFNVMDVSFNGGNRADATDFLQDGLKGANDPTSYAAFLIHERKESEAYLRRVLSDNMLQSIRAETLEEIVQAGSNLTARLTAERTTSRTAPTLSTHTTRTATATREESSAPKAAARTTAAPKQEESMLTSAYNKVADVASDVGEGIVTKAKAVKHNLAEAAEVIGGSELRRAGRSALNGDFSGAVSHTYNAAANKLSEGTTAVSSTLSNAGSAAVSTVSGWGKGISSTLGWN